jgi:hypothetical protein
MQQGYRCARALLHQRIGKKPEESGVGRDHAPQQDLRQSTQHVRSRECEQAETEDVLQQNRPASQGMIAEAPGEQDRRRRRQYARDEGADAQISRVDERDRVLVSYRCVDRAEVEGHHSEKYQDGCQGSGPSITAGHRHHRRGDGHRKPYARGPYVAGREPHQPREYGEQHELARIRLRERHQGRVGFYRRQAPFERMPKGRHSTRRGRDALSRWQLRRPRSCRSRARRRACVDRACRWRPPELRRPRGSSKAPYEAAAACATPRARCLPTCRIAI